MLKKEEITQSVRDAIEGTDIFIVEVKVVAGNKISVFVDDPAGLSIDACAKISKHIEADFDREAEDYELQVSSPGLSQPFKVLGQYVKNIGKEVRIILKDGVTYDGKLERVEEDAVEIVMVDVEKVPGQKKKVEKTHTEVLSINDIASTKLIISF